IPSTGWHIYVGIPTDAVLADVRGAMVRDSLIDFAIILLALFLALYFSRRISQPIRSLANTAREVRDGRVPTRSPVAGPLEIAEVAAEFNAMLDVRHKVEHALRESEARLRLMVGQLPVMLWTTDTNLRFTSNSGKGFEAVHVV